MAASKTSSPSPEYRHDEGSDTHSIGVVIDGAFIPFVSTSGQRVADRVSALKEAGKGEGSSESGEASS